MMSGRNRFPFTATQWQELEHQALIFKYMVSGMPIPSDLLFTIKRSLESSLSSKLLLHQPQHIGWNCFEMGFGRKIDPEPGRCRRTDGKKWRCSKEAYPDSKYCERHMHRGRNRSRKPVEITTTTATAANYASKTTIPISSITKNQNPSVLGTPSNTNLYSLSSLSSIVSDTPHPHSHTQPSYNNPHPHSHTQPSYNNTHLHPSFPYHHSRPPGPDFSSQENTTHLLLDSGPYSHPDKDYRYGCGMKEEVDEHAFFTESSGAVRSYSGSSMEDPWQLTPLTVGSSLKQRTHSGFQSGYPFLQLQGLTDTPKPQKQDQYFNVSDSDMKFELARDDKPQKVMHHFFDERPKNKDSWMDSEDKSSSYVPVSTTQLSISIPNSSQDFFIAHDDK